MNDIARGEGGTGKVGLIAFGILHLLMGGMCALLVPLLVVGAIASAKVGGPSAPQVSPHMMLPGILFYLALAVWFVWLGIGSIMARRWARALILAASWIWLVCGLGGMVFAGMMLPGMYDRMGESGQVPEAVAQVMKWAVMGFLAVIYLVLPGAMVLFYGRSAVREACEEHDPCERWTDRCPLPVLALSLMFASWAGGMLLMGCYNWAVPVFGTILDGSAGAAVVLLVCVLSGLVCRGVYRLRPWAWWAAIAMTLGWGGSTAITFSRVDFLVYYEKMGMSQQQLDMVREQFMPEMGAAALFLGVWVLAFLGYLVFLRKYFRAAES